MAENSDQWKNDGDCRKCRRVKYCHTKCRAHDRYNKRVIGQIIRERTALGVIEDQLAALQDGELQYLGKDY